MSGHNQQQILNFIKTQPLAVLSTMSPDGHLQSAVIGISENDDLSLIFGTFNNTRKFTNIKHNPQVAVVIGWDKITVQYEGTATQLSEDELKAAKQTHLVKLPSSVKFAELSHQAYFKIVPKWIRYTDFTNEKIYGQVMEISF